MSTCPIAGRAQQMAPPPLIAVLDGVSVGLSELGYVDAFCAGLRELGYIEGRNIRIEYRYADGVVDRLPAMAAELVALNPAVIVSAPVPAVLAARKVTTTIPIVMANSADPVAFGLVQSLSSPGGNVTGLTNFAEDLAAKQLDILSELLPSDSCPQCWGRSSAVRRPGPRHGKSISMQKRLNSKICDTPALGSEGNIGRHQDCLDLCLFKSGIWLVI